MDSQIPSGDVREKWDKARFQYKLVNPANRRKYHVIVVGTGLAGAAAASTLSEQGYQVSTFCLQDSPRRAHSIAAQGGINAAKNYPNDGDSVWRLFYDTVKGGDYRAREANVYRLAQVSGAIIDQCVAQGVPFAREYGGTLSNRSFGGAQVSRTFYARGQTGQQLLLGAYSSMMKEVGKGRIRSHTRSEMVELVVADGRAVGSSLAISSQASTSATWPMRFCCAPAATAMCFTFPPTPWPPTAPRPGEAIRRGRFLPTLALLKFTPPVFPCTGRGNPSSRS